MFRVVLAFMLLMLGLPYAYGQTARTDFKPLETFRDCENCPEMVVLPRGEFMMGATKEDRKVNYGQMPSDELPRHKVRIGYSFAIGKFTVTVAEFAAYVEETGAKVGGECELRIPDSGPNRGKFIGTISANANSEQRGRIGSHGPGGLALVDHADFRQPGTKVGGNQPATCISMREAQAYLDWLSAKTGRRYRLPSEAEFEYATRAGETGAFFYGGSAGKLCKYGNFADRKSVYGAAMAAPCAEKGSREYTYPVGSFKPNKWGLYDMVGNTFQYTQDCYFANYDGAPDDGSPRVADPDGSFGGCTTWTLRGYNIDSVASLLRSASRCGANDSVDYRSNVLAIRVAVSLSDDAWDLN